MASPAEPSRVSNPAAREALASVAEGDRAGIDLAAEAGRSAFEGGWSRVNRLTVKP